ncbi:hypothetical protein BT63DRAFT_439983 [Microthyrium microscopicum]|uniref:DUF7730 domain-containing protein n=1 Tax=Microthyrium microscopicum TaxID=703497 RepID=A0A6A6UEH4_9PEZI|nr:hypothetical protein BT63DRAFT_439983 [Microthyrium microscopicum]
MSDAMNNAPISAEKQQWLSSSVSQPHEQLQSPFFSKFPAEIRIMIYQQLLPVPGHAVHLESYHDHRIHYHVYGAVTIGNPCLFACDFATWEGHSGRNEKDSFHMNHRRCFSAFPDKVGKVIKSYGAEWEARSRSSIVALMLTCAKATAELRHELYSSTSMIVRGYGSSSIWSLLTTFSDAALSSLKTLVIVVEANTPMYIPNSEYLRRCGPEENDRQLANILISTIREEEAHWRGLWQIVGLATSLQDLHVKIHDARWRISEAELLRPLQALTVPNFTVQLPWLRSYKPKLALDADEGYAFKILRPTPEQARVRPDEAEWIGSLPHRSDSCCMVTAKLLLCLLTFTGAHDLGIISVQEVGDIHVAVAETFILYEIYKPLADVARKPSQACRKGLRLRSSLDYFMSHISVDSRTLNQILLS